MKKLFFSKKFFITLAFCTTIAFAGLATVGMFGMGSAMHMDETGAMAGCPFDGFAKVCSMGLVEHLQAWQNFFNVFPSKTYFLIGALVFLTLAFLTRGFDWDARLIRKSLYHKERFRLSIFHFLEEAFSQGIVHPKIY